MIKDIEETMFSLISTWNDLHNTIHNNQYSTPEVQESTRNQVCILAKKMREEFEKNEQLIDSLEETPSLNTRVILEQHKTAVNRYKQAAK